jgi:hypothetical protein
MSAADLGVRAGRWITQASCLLLLAAACRDHRYEEVSQPTAAPTPAIEPTPHASLPLSQAAEPSRATAPSSEPRAATAAEFPVTFYPALRLRTAQELDRPFESSDQIEVRAGPEQPKQVVHNCRELLAVQSPSMQTVPDDEVTRKPFFNMVVDCRSIEILQRAQPARASRITALFTASNLAELLPPDLGDDFVYDFENKVKRANAQCRSWKAFDSTARVKRRSEDTFDLEAEDWQGVLQFYARADFDGDGWEDLLVRRDGHAPEGTLASFELFVLGRADADGCIRARLVR